MAKYIDNKEKIDHLISVGSEITGGTIGGIIGFISGGPIGALAGNALGVIISKNLEESLIDIANRSLSKREEVRIGAAAIYSLGKIKQYLELGRKPREDGFFEGGKKKRSNAEEIFEGVLLKSKNEHEEKKIKITANIFANIAFSSGFSLGEANQLLQIIDQLTYREICIMAMLRRKATKRDIKLRDKDYKIEKVVKMETISILQDVLHLYQVGMINSKSPASSGIFVLLSLGDIVPDNLLLSDLGVRYSNIMGLEDIPESEIRALEKYLS